MQPLKLFMLMLGCTPIGRNTEQHDVFFTIASSIKYRGSLIFGLKQKEISISMPGGR